MIKVKMLVSMSGPKVVRSRGDVVEVSGKEAGRMIEAGFAMAHRDEPSENTADKSEAEKATATTEAEKATATAETEKAAATAGAENTAAKAKTEKAAK